VIAITAVLAIPSAAVGRTLPIRSTSVTGTEVKAVAVVKESKTQSSKAQAQLRQAARQVGEIRQTTWACQDALGVTRTRASADIWSLPQSVGYRVWVSKKWVAIAKGCQTALSLRSIPETNDWLTAVKLVQRIYPGTSDWLLFISHREGGWGGFVMNHQGSGCGGWMQYAPSTYWAYSGDAFADAKSKGFIVNDAWNQWTNPMGQALTGAFMRFTGRDAHHWDL
jgi:hypothetical protein